MKLSKRNFSADNLDNISTDPHINHSVILAGGADKDPAGPIHLDTLFDQHALFRLSDAVGYHPCRRASRRRTGRRVLTVVEHHASVQPGRGIHGLAADKVKKSSTGTLEVFLRAFHVHAQAAQDF
jgi:hypothetical protein